VFQTWLLIEELRKKKIGEYHCEINENSVETETEFCSFRILELNYKLVFLNSCVFVCKKLFAK